MHRTGVLLINLGTPNSPQVSDVRRYLREFLSDPRVLDMPALVRWLLLNVLILPFRPRRSARAYQSIWQAEGSPLLLHGLALRDKVVSIYEGRVSVELGMRYGQPSIESALSALRHEGCDELIILPLFPQYSSAASGSAIAEVMRVITQQHNIPTVSIISDFYDHPRFIDALARTIEAPLKAFRADHILMSYHGLPLRHVQKSDGQAFTHCSYPHACAEIKATNRYCYRAQCYATSRLLAQALDLSAEHYTVSFQSRLGATPWIKPYTDQLLVTLREQGVRRLAVTCPSFTADCLETLEEIGIQLRKQWQRLGGEEFACLPCLNSELMWAYAIVDMINEQRV